MDVYRTIVEHRRNSVRNCINSYLISMTQGSSDLLEVVVFAKEAGLYVAESDGTVTSTLQSVPLFETIDDLHAAPGIMSTLLTFLLTKIALILWHSCTRSCSATQTVIKTAV